MPSPTSKSDQAECVWVVMSPVAMIARFATVSLRAERNAARVRLPLCARGRLHGARNVIQARSVLSDATGGVRFGKASMQLRHEGGLATSARTVEDQVLTVPHAFEQIRAQFANTTVHGHRPLG